MPSLFGTDSFWTGVDVPGDSLAQVVITRLPFDPPTHPILEARAEHIRDRGGNPFANMSSHHPFALIKFRQGVEPAHSARPTTAASSPSSIRACWRKLTRRACFSTACSTPHWESPHLRHVRAVRFLPFA